jgi:hypothetical protein
VSGGRNNTPMTAISFVSSGVGTTLPEKTPPLPLWERALSLGEPKVSLGEKGEGAAETGPDG